MTQALSDGAPHQPLGPTVDTRPAHRPRDVRLQGRFGAVEKLAARHAARLWDATRGHDQIWTYMSAYGPFDSWPSFSDWVATRAQFEDPFSYAVLDRSGGAIGLATLMEIRPAMRVIEIGHIVYAPELQRTPLATEAQFLLARYVFEVLGYRRYEWKCKCAERAVMPRGGAPGVYVRGHPPAAHGCERPQSRHRVLLHARR